MPTVPLLMLGERLHERYEITKVLENNRYGQTCLARDAARSGEPLCKIKVFKTLDSDLISLENARELFFSEAQTLQQLGELNDKLPRLVDYFEEGGEFYLVEELVAAQPIAASLRPGESWSEQDVLLMLGDVLKTLEFIHDRKVVHGDINPQNIWRRDSDNQFCLANFSLRQKITNSIWQQYDRPLNRPVNGGSSGGSHRFLDEVSTSQDQESDNLDSEQDLDETVEFEIGDLGSPTNQDSDQTDAGEPETTGGNRDRVTSETNVINAPPMLVSTIENLGAIGTPSYMPVEQTQEKLRPDFDLYALGITAIQLLTGLHPSRFRYDNQNKTILWQDRSNASYELEEVLDRMISADPNLRYGSAATVLSDLAALLKPISPTEITNAKLPELSGLWWRPVAILLLAIALLSGGMYVFKPLLSALWQGDIKFELPRFPLPRPKPANTPNPDQSSLNRQEFKFTNLQQKSTLSGHEGWVRAVKFLKSGHVLVSGSYDRTLRLWNISEQQAYEVMSKHQGFSSGVNAIATSPDGYTIASGNLDKSIRFWDARSAEPTFALNGHEGQILALDFDPTGLLLASASADRTVKLWNLENHNNTYTFTGHDAEVSAVAISSDGKIVVSGDRNRNIKVWDINSGTEIYSWQHTAPIRAIAISPDGKIIAGGAQDGTIKLWDRQTGAELATLSGHTDAIAAIAFNNNGQILASGSHDQTIKLWQPVTGTQLQTLTAHTAPVLSLDFNPVDNTLVSSGADKMIIVWQ
jgi:WD40 repeat protein/tRNA A-37 threonylcarbamoyl transferase component Bud32